MIKTLSIRNFQSHKDNTLEFSGGVNVIVGQSRSGKTSIVRALRWLVENRPSGDEFRRHGSKGPTSVSVTLDSGDTISRIKSNSDNIYKLNEERFSGFGTDVPTPIREALNITDINVQQQFDTPFLLFDSPGSVARYLNSLVNLEKIDLALSNVNAMKRQNEQDARQWQTRASELDEAVGSFPDLEGAEGFIIELENMEASAADGRTRLSSLAAIQSNLGKLRRTLFLVPEHIPNKVDELLGKHSRLSQLEYTSGLLAELRKKLSWLLKTKEPLHKALGMSGDIDRLSKIMKVVDSKKKLLSMTRQTEAKLERLRRSLVELTAKIKVDKERLLKLMPETCPLCEQEIR